MGDPAGAPACKVLVGAPICLILAISFGLKGVGVWIGLAAGLAVAAVAMCLRFEWMTRAGKPA